jgi:uracil phosphoribosyltransferase
MLFVLDQTPSIANQFLKQLRDQHIQTDRMRFRKNVERIGEIMAYEVSKTFAYEKQVITTPLASMEMKVLNTSPVLLTILRAGLPFFQGFANFFDDADCGFIGAYREEGNGDIAIHLDYIASADLTDRVVILIDPMLATGKSVINCLDVLLKKGTPSHLHIVSLVAAPEGIKHLQQHVKVSYTLWTASLDQKLDSRYYIVPGLGDAGDLSFGVKI